jgi:hypothetical protein
MNEVVVGYVAMEEICEERSQGTENDLVLSACKVNNNHKGVY